MLHRPEITITSLDGNLQRGGWIANGQVLGDTDAVWPGLYLQYRGRGLAGFVDPTYRMAFNGWVMGKPDFTFDRYSSNASFQFGTPDNLLRGSLQAISATVVDTPANSHQYTSFQFSDVIEHILRGHTNFVYNATPGAGGSPEGIITSLDMDADSVLFDEINDRFLVGKSENIWATLQQIGGGDDGGGEFHRPWFDRRGVFHYQPATPFIDPQPTAKGTLTKSHIRGSIQVRHIADQFDKRTGQVQTVAGIRPDTIYKAKYPASPGTGRIVQKLSGIFANTQDVANTQATRLYKWLNRAYTLVVPVDIGLVMFGDDGRGLDLADRVLVTYDGPAEDADTGAGVYLDLSAASFYVYGINIQPDHVRRTGTAMVTLEQDIL
jgi:hypothetical protein